MENHVFSELAQQTPQHMYSKKKTMTLWGNLTSKGGWQIL